MRRAAAIGLWALMAVSAMATADAASAPRASPTLRRDVGPTPMAVAPTPVVDATDLAALASRGLLFPVPSVRWQDVRDTYTDPRRSGPHQALDIPAARRAAVIASDDGTIAKLFASVPGGLTIYLFDRERRFAYYYAHLDAYADDLHETQAVQRGDVLGYVGTSGDAAPDAPHLHFAIFKLEPIPRWWRGTPIDPYPLLAAPSVSGSATPPRPSPRVGHR